MKCLLTRPVEIPFQDSIIAEADDGQHFIDSPERVNIKCGLYLSTSFHPELFSVIMQSFAIEFTSPFLAEES